METLTSPLASINRIVRLALGLYITVLSFGLICALMWVWPAGVQSGTAPGSDIRYLLLAAVAGALGSYIHLASSFVEYAGHERLHASWIWWYLLRPWIGSALALVVYCVLRAGLITGASDQSTGALNPYGIAAVSALSGLFSKQATEKLREVFQNICATGGRPVEDRLD